jgi:hypothetical protein
MTVAIHLLPEDYTLLGIDYQKFNMVSGEDVKPCHQISIGLLFVILEFLIYKKGDK